MQPIRSKPPKLTAEEIAAAIDSKAFPAILDVRQAAAMLGISHHTLYRAASHGEYRNAVRRRKPMRFWRDRLIAAFFESN